MKPRLGGMASLIAPPPAPPAPRTQRELIEQARAAARLNEEIAPRPGWKTWVSPFEARPFTLSKPVDEPGHALVLQNRLGGLLKRRARSGVQR